MDLRRCKIITPITITYLILLVSIILFLSDRLRPDLIALLVVVALGVTGVLTSAEAFSGFSRSAVITVMAIFVLAEGLYRSGLTAKIGQVLVRIAGRKESWLVVAVMTAGAFLSLFMNNIAASSMLLPAVSGAARRTGIRPSRLLMPLAFSTLLGGMATLLTSTNIVVSSLLRDRNLPGFGLLDFLPLGLPIVIAGLLYMATIGRRLLPTHPPKERLLERSQPTADDLVDIYRLGERLTWARVPAGTRLDNMALAKSRLQEDYNLNLLAVRRAGKNITNPRADFIFSGDDILLLEGRLDKEECNNLLSFLEILPPEKQALEDFNPERVVMVEAVLSPRSMFVGKTLRGLRFREKYGMNVLGIWRTGRPIRTSFAELPLQFGDALLMQGSTERLAILHTEPELIILEEEEGVIATDPWKSWLALVVMGVTLLAAAIGPWPVGEVMLAGAVVMVLCGVLNMDQAYQSIEWKTVFLIAGMLPLGVALGKTGAATSLADNLARLASPFGPLVLLACLVILAVAMTQVMNGAAVAVLLAPIAIEIAQMIHVDPRSFAMGVALATSMAFITPLGHPVNMLVMSPGGYRFRDYVKVGLPLTVLLVVIVIALLPVFWPLYH